MPRFEAQVEQPGAAPWRPHMVVNRPDKEDARRIFAVMLGVPIEQVKLREVVA
jgi:hypothetical protein